MYGHFPLTPRPRPFAQTDEGLITTCCLVGDSRLQVITVVLLGPSWWLERTSETLRVTTSFCVTDLVPAGC